MKILFYLPVVTPWWFDNIVEPLIRRLAVVAEVYVLAPKPWRGTGIGERELARCVDLPDIRWCIMDGRDHPSTRTKPQARSELIAFAREIAPDYVLCRSADCETVQSFPGKVRFLMEGGVAAFPLPSHWIVLQESPLDQGLLPDLPDDAKSRLEQTIEPAWSGLHARHKRSPSEREALLSRAGIAGDRPILLLPLEYEHEENFFQMHRVGARPNHRLVKEIAESIGHGFLLAVTDHPLNQLYVDPAPLNAAIEKLGKRAVLLPATIDDIPATLALAPHVDGIIVGDSKAFSLATLCGTPLLRRSRFKAGDWIAAYSDMAPFLKAVSTSTAVTASEDDARLWTAFHLANNIFDPQDPDLTAEEIVGRIDQPIDCDRWDAAVARVRAAVPELYQ